MHLNLVGATKSGLRADGIHPSWGRGQGDVPQTILETSEKAQSSLRHSTCLGQTPIYILSVSGQCRVVSSGLQARIKVPWEVSPNF